MNVKTMKKHMTGLTILKRFIRKNWKLLKQITGKLIHQISQLKSNKSPAYDDIPAKILKDCKYLI